MTLLDKIKTSFNPIDKFQVALKEILENFITDDNTLKKNLAGNTTGTHTGNVITDSVAEQTVGAGITADGVLLKDGKVELTKGTVTQETAITTGVTIDKPSGVITTVSTTVAALSNAAFIVTNAFCKATSVITLCEDDSATAGFAKANVQTVTDGAFTINISNVHPTNAFNNVIKIHFIIV